MADDIPTSPPADGIVPEPTPPPAPAPAPRPPSLIATAVHRVVEQAVNLVFLVVLAAVLTLALRATGVEWANALGFGCLLSFFGGFFFRSLLAGLLGKNLAARVPGLVQPPAPQPATPVEGAREVVETVVFVVVLVLMLKSFVAEAFVIPTGSMAETLWGYQKDVTCPKCGHRFPVNASSEAEQDRGPGTYINGCTCPNCRQKIVMHRPNEAPPAEGPDRAVIVDPSFVVGDWAPPRLQGLVNGPRSGDRVLVSKYPYDLPGKGPQRLDVVVFKFPGDEYGVDFPRSGPFKNHVPINYIKRLMGLPGESLAIHRGKVFILRPELSPAFPEDDEARKDPAQAVAMWRMSRGWLHVDNGATRDLFKAGKFDIARKSPDVLRAMMRIVYDNDLPAKDLTGLDFQRWNPARDSGWSEDEASRGFSFSGGPETTWLRYRHVLRDSANRPELITDFMGYNTFLPKSNGGGSNTGQNWVGDLVVECQVRAEKGEGKFVLELSRADDRFQAEFDAATGECALKRLDDGKKPVVLDTKPTAFKGPGTHDLRFANVDDRLVVWVNGKLPFGEGVPYDAARTLVPTVRNDLDKPASLGASGGRFTVRHLKLYRDTYYTVGGSRQPGAADVEGFEPHDPANWKAKFEDGPFTTYYVQPGHYLCLGDNSPESADSRSWGLVPARLMLGRAVLVYFPFPRVGRIR